MSYYDTYYSAQSGGGGRGVTSVYIGSRGQRGHGIGSFLAGLFRRALPLLAKGARVVGKEALRTGMNLIDDITENNMSFKDSLNNRLIESGMNLKRKAKEKISDLMEGSGYKGLRRKRALQSRDSSRARKYRSRKKKKSTRKRGKKKKKAVKRLVRKGKLSKTRRRKTSKKNKVQDIFD